MHCLGRALIWHNMLGTSRSMRLLGVFTALSRGLVERQIDLVAKVAEIGKLIG